MGSSFWSLWIDSTSTVEHHSKVGQYDWRLVCRGLTIPPQRGYDSQASNMQHYDLGQTALSSDHWSTLTWLWVSERFHWKCHVKSAIAHEGPDSWFHAKSLRPTRVLKRKRLIWCCLLGWWSVKRSLRLILSCPIYVNMIKCDVLPIWDAKEIREGHRWEPHCNQLHTCVCACMCFGFHHGNKKSQRQIGQQILERMPKELPMMERTSHTHTITLYFSWRPDILYSPYTVTER